MRSWILEIFELNTAKTLGTTMGISMSPYLANLVMSKSVLSCLLFQHVTREWQLFSNIFEGTPCNN